MYKSTKEWEVHLGERIKAVRLRMNMSQAELASRCDISTLTVARLEKGQGSSLSSLIKVLKVLGEDQRLEQLVPDIGISPLQQFTHKKQRERAGGSRNKGARSKGASL